MRTPDVRPEWANTLADAFADPSMRLLSTFLRERLAAGAVVHPPMRDVFAALDAAAPADVKVVILGQDPYHNAGQAHGLSFSVRRGVPVPPSLVNIQKELRDDLGIEPAAHGDLGRWARQGVLLLNTLLTVEQGSPLAHKGKGWERFTDAVIRATSDDPAPKVYILWGAHARKKARLVDAVRHLVIESAHPSPLSAHVGFLGSRPFGRANRFLVEHGREPIDWRQDDEPGA